MLATIPFSVAAHHSMSEFNRDVVTEVEGVVSRVSWTNPHILLEVTSTDPKGVKAVWTLRRRRRRATPPRAVGR
jgi:hypothetical protein